MDSIYDLIVIGAGPGGYVAAIRAAQLGMKVLCVEKEAVPGGTCLRVGCIPSKALLESSELFYKTRREFGMHGINVEASVDLPKLMARKDSIVTQLTKGIGMLFKKNGVEHITGQAKFTGPKTIAIGDQDFEAKAVIIATGAKPASLPGIDFDGESIVDSTGALSFDKIPESMIVIGGGAIGLEMASVWSRLGANMTVLEYLPQIVPGMDAEVAELAKRILNRQKIKIETGVRVTGAKTANGAVTVTAEGKKEGDPPREWTVDKLLVSVGRRPVVDGLNLNAADIETDDRGFIPVDEHCETKTPGVYAVGDVIGGLMLAHKASQEAVSVVERLAGRQAKVNYNAIPAVVFTDPEIASVGKTEEQLKEANVTYKKGSFPYAANGRAKALSAKEGFVKFLADPDTDLIYGAHIIGLRAGDLIAEIALAMHLGASVIDIARTTHAHPTLAEIVKEAALAMHGEAIHI